MVNVKWCPMTDSNRRPTIYETVALPTELMGRGISSLGFGIQKFLRHFQSRDHAGGVCFALACNVKGGAVVG